MIKSLLVVLLFFYGVAVGNYHIFPYKYLKYAKDIILTGKIQKKIYQQYRPEITQHKIIKGKADVVMFGDSLTEDGLWSELLYPYKAFNRGIGGDNVSNMILRVDSVIKLQPKVVFLLAGINDFMGRKSVDEVMNDYIKLVEILQKNKIEVIIQSTLGCSLKKVSYCGNLMVRITELNKRLIAFAQSQGVSYLDLNKGLLDDKVGLKDEYTYDGVHLLGKAYSYWSGRVLEEIKKRSI